MRAGLTREEPDRRLGFACVGFFRRNHHRNTIRARFSDPDDLS
jgi:hypothetical protein